MLVKGIDLDCIKCFAQATSVDFCTDRATPHKWVVIYGDNGLGKSTLLRAIGMALTGQPALNSLLPNAERVGAAKEGRRPHFRGGEQGRR